MMNQDQMCSTLFGCLLLSAVRARVIDEPVPQFEDGVTAGLVKSPSVVEASGLCASRKHENVLYTQNDSGDKNKIYAIDATNGGLLSTLVVNGSINWDWEDLACGPCAEGRGSCIYIADTGGNYGNHVENKIYRVSEPSVIHDQTILLDSVLQFSWNESDCETIVVDPFGEVYLVSKVKEGTAKLYHPPRSAWGSNTRVELTDGVYLPMETPDGPVGGDVSVNGKEFLLKTYRKIFYWSIKDRDLATAIANQPTAMPYIKERQGESVCFDASGSGYYTLGEGVNSTLYYFRRKVTGSSTSIHNRNTCILTLALLSLACSILRTNE